MVGRFVHHGSLGQELQDRLPRCVSPLAAVGFGTKAIFPGDIFADWRNQYGNIYLLKLTSESRVSNMIDETF